MRQHRPASATRTLRPWIAGVCLSVALASLSILGSAGVNAESEEVISGYGRAIHFSGYDWLAKTSSVLVGPGPNFFSDSEENVWTDEQGRLHLRLTRDPDGRWFAAEVVLQASLGYGVYRFGVDGPSHELDRNVVFGMFTWHDDPEEHHRELDIEIARWGNRSGPNGRYSVQPYDAPGRTFDFDNPPAGAQATHSLDWQPGRARFQSWLGWTSNPPSPTSIIAEHSFNSDIPRAGGEQPRINLWLDRGAAPLDESGIEVIVSSFHFVPADSLAP